MTEEGSIRYRLQRLYRRREVLSHQLDRAYIHDNVSDYLVIENQYKRIALLIENLLHRQRTALSGADGKSRWMAQA